MTDTNVPGATAPVSALLAGRPSGSDPGALHQWLLERYISGPRDLEFRDRLTDILQVGPDGRLMPRPLQFGIVKETRGIVVLGETDAGKSVMIHRNLAKLAAEEHFTPSDGVFPREVVAIRLLHDTTLKSLASEICTKTGYPNLHAATLGWKAWEIALQRLKRCEIAIVWIDEAHHLLRIPNSKTKPLSEKITERQKDVLRAFKTLLQSDGAVAVILSGILELDGELRKDDETSRRYQRLLLQEVRTSDQRQELADAVGKYFRAAELLPPPDANLLDRLLFAKKNAFGGSIELVLASIRRPLFDHRKQVTLDDFALAFDRDPKCGGINPFLVKDWEAADLVRMQPIDERS